MRSIGAVVMGMQLVACSLTMSSVAQPTKVEALPDCSDSAIPPAVDTTLAVISGIIFTPSITFAVQPGCGLKGNSSDCTAIREVALVSGLASLLMVGAAVRGYHVKQECRAAHAEHDAWAATRPDAPRAPSPPDSGSHSYAVLLGLGIAGTVV